MSGKRQWRVCWRVRGMMTVEAEDATEAGNFAMEQLLRDPAYVADGLKIEEVYEEARNGQNEHPLGD